MPTFKRSVALIAGLGLALPLFTGCQANYQAQRQHIPSEVTTDKPTVGRPTLGMPMFLPESDVSVVPFTVDRARRWLEDADRFEAEAMSKVSRSSYVAYTNQGGLGQIGISQSVRWHNAVIQPKLGEGQLVLNEKGMISRFEIVGHWVENEREDKNEEKTYRFVPKALLFLATTQDTDGDKQLTRSDANVLLAADENGGGLHRITPADMHVQATRYNAEHNIILIMLASDTNGDGLFTEADSAAPYTYTPGSEDAAKPLVDPRKTEQAERLLK